MKNDLSQFKCPMFFQFLDESVGSQEEICQIQEFIGYCFFPEIKFHKCLILAGTGAVEKLALVELIRELVGPKKCVSVLIDEKLMGNGLALHEKTVNIVEWINVDMTALKHILGGDTLIAHKKYCNAFSFIPYCKHVFISNDTHHIFSAGRTIVINFKPIPDHVEKFTSEKKEIVKWAEEGLNRLLKNNQFTASIQPVGLAEGF